MRNDSYDLNRLPAWPLIIDQLPTKASFVKDGDFTLRYGLAYDAVRINGRFKGDMMLRMKIGAAGRNQNFDAFDERDPQTFREESEELIHPYLVDLARGNYVIDGGVPEERVTLKLKPTRNGVPAMRCFSLAYNDLRRSNGYVDIRRATSGQFIRRNFPLHLMSSTMELQGKFEHNPERDLFAQTILGDGDSEQILIGAKPEVIIESLDVENNTIEVSRPGWIAILRDDFYERLCITEEAIHEGFVKPAMEMFAEIDEQTYHPAKAPIPVDLRGLGPRGLVDSYYHKRTNLHLAKKRQAGVKLSSDPPAPPSSPDASA